MPVAQWLVEALDPQPGQRLLELAAGTGEVGFLAAERIQPDGELISSDFAPEMLTAAQARAEALRLTGVRFKQIDAESIDLTAGSLDGVLCRWGYMLMADPGAALRETRRVLRPEGRVALAAWTGPDDNPWSSLIGRELVAQGHLEPPPPGEPGQFSWADPGIIEEHLAGVGFVDDINVETVGWTYDYADFDAWWAAAMDLSFRSADAVAGLGGTEVTAVKDVLRDAAAPYTAADGSLSMPAKSWVASAAA